MQPALAVLGFSTFIGQAVQTDYSCNVPNADSDPLPFTFAFALSDGASPKSLAAVVIVKTNVDHKQIVPGVAAFVRMEPRLSIMIRSKLITTAAPIDLPKNTSPNDAQMRDLANQVFVTFPP